MPVTFTGPDFNFESSHGPTSRTTTGQLTMNAQEKLGKILDEIQNEKDIEISRLRDENERLRQENERLKQLKGPDLLISNPNSNQCRIKAIELKKAIEDYLSDGRPSIRTNANVSISSSYPPITNLHSNVEVNKSTNENPKNHRQVVDESTTNGMSRHAISSFREEFNYGNQQQTRPEDDTDIVNEATGMQQQPRNYYPSYNTSLPTVVNNNNNNIGRRFNNVNMGGGMNNNRNRNNGNHNSHPSHNNNNNNNNNNYNNKQNQLTIFVSWSGKMTTDELNELFDVNEIDEIRYTNQKQFAHIDLKTENALTKALELDGKTKNQNQGVLRVEKGKPRSSNPSENGQRTQHQNKNHNRQNNNNKNPNGYNPQKHNNNNKPYYPNNNNGHNPQYSSFTPEDNKSFSIPNGSNGLSSSLNQQEHNKSDSS